MQSAKFSDGSILTTAYRCRLDFKNMQTVFLNVFEDYVFECSEHFTSNGDRIFNLRCCMYLDEFMNFLMRQHYGHTCASHFRIMLDASKLMRTRAFHKRSGYHL